MSRALIRLPKYVRPSYSPSLALGQPPLRREDWVEEVVVVRVRGLDKHNMSVAG